MSNSCCCQNPKRGANVSRNFAGEGWRQQGREAAIAWRADECQVATLRRERWHGGRFAVGRLGISLWPRGAVLAGIARRQFVSAMRYGHGHRILIVRRHI